MGSVKQLTVQKKHVVGVLLLAIIVSVPFLVAKLKAKASTGNDIPQQMPVDNRLLDPEQEEKIEFVQSLPSAMALEVAMNEFDGAAEQLLLAAAESESASLIKELAEYQQSVATTYKYADILAARVGREDADFAIDRMISMLHLNHSKVLIHLLSVRSETRAGSISAEDVP